MLESKAFVGLLYMSVAWGGAFLGISTVTFEITGLDISILGFSLLVIFLAVVMSISVLISLEIEMPKLDEWGEVQGSWKIKYKIKEQLKEATG